MASTWAWAAGPRLAVRGAGAGSGLSGPRLTAGGGAGGAVVVVEVSGGAVVVVVSAGGSVVDVVSRAGGGVTDRDGNGRSRKGMLASTVGAAGQATSAAVAAVT